jgi:hypothetical protein
VSGVLRLEAPHRADPLLELAVVALQAVVEVFDLPVLRVAASRPSRRNEAIASL